MIKELLGHLRQEAIDYMSDRLVYGNELAKHLRKLELATGRYWVFLQENISDKQIVLFRQGGIAKRSKSLQELSEFILKCLGSNIEKTVVFEDALISEKDSKVCLPPARVIFEKSKAYYLIDNAIAEGKISIIMSTVEQADSYILIGAIGRNNNFLEGFDNSILSPSSFLEDFARTAEYIIVFSFVYESFLICES